MPLKIRAAQPADALSLGMLATQVFLETYATDGIRDSIASHLRQTFSCEAMQDLLAGPGHVLLLCNGVHLCGFAQLSQIDAAQRCELQRLYLLQRFCNQGWGHVLLAAAETQAASNNARQMWLTVWAGNQRALHFYQREGWHKCGETLFEMEGEQHLNHVLEKALSA